MDKKTVVLTFSDWVEQFRPVPNLLNQDAGLVGHATDKMGRTIDAGILFDAGVTGEESAFVRQMARDQPDRVWTFLNEDALDPSAELLDRNGFTRADAVIAHDLRCAVGDIVDEDDNRIDASSIQNGLQQDNRVGYLVTEVPADPECDYTILMDRGLALAYHAEYDDSDPMNAGPSPQ